MPPGRKKGSAATSSMPLPNPPPYNTRLSRGNQLSSADIASVEEANR